ncbi:hypothetical protein [Streptomyces sp. RO-S4]|uniref:hypothetical protein n=2 Tax=unclassified Streptomyces TaxID=2593676 RepID=UPI00208F148A|nr:hypothetical protein [Streptomyces sp. RO-S4]
MTSLLDDVRTSADWIASALDSSGYRADFSPGSLHDVERFMTEHSNPGTAVEGGLLAAGLGARLFGVGCYVGETVRLSLGGVWEADDTDAAGELNVRVRLAGGAVVWPVRRVVKRFQNGPEDSVTAYAVLLGVDVPVFSEPQADRHKRRGLFRRR